MKTTHPALFLPLVLLIALPGCQSVTAGSAAANEGLSSAVEEISSPADGTGDAKRWALDASLDTVIAASRMVLEEHCATVSQSEPDEHGGLSLLGRTPSNLPLEVVIEPMTRKLILVTVRFQHPRSYFVTNAVLGRIRQEARRLQQDG